MTIYHPQSANSTYPLASAKTDPSLSKLYDIIDNSKIGRYYNTDVYYSFNNIKLFHGGRDYSENTTVVFPDPEHDEGTAATATVYLGLTSASINISGGAEHQPGDKYVIYPSGYLDEDVSDKLPAIVRILSVNEGDNNSVNKWTLISPGYGFSNGTPTVVPDYINNRENVSPATITLNNDLYTIVDIQFTSYGTGYLKSPYPRYLTFDNAGSGTGALATVNSDPNLVLYSKESIALSNTNVEDIPIGKDSLYEFDNISSKNSFTNYYAVFSHPVITHNDYE